MVVSSRKVGVNYALVPVIARGAAGRHSKSLCAVCTTEAKSTKHQEASEGYKCTVLKDWHQERKNILTQGHSSEPRKENSKSTSLLEL